MLTRAAIPFTKLPPIDEISSLDLHVRAVLEVCLIIFGPALALAAWLML